MNKKVFTVKDGSNELELCTRKPTAEIRIKSQLIFNRAWKDAVDSGSMLQRNIEKEAEKLGLWSESVKQTAEGVANELRDLERKLRAAATNFSSKEEARQCALKMRELRSELIELNRSKDELYPFTAESYADEARTRYLVSMCTLDNNTGKPYFKSYEDYLSHSEGEVAQAALGNYYEFVYGDLMDIQKGWFENSWLLKHKYVDDKFRLVNEKGQLVDSDGRTIDEDGRYVNEYNQFVDRDGNLVDSDGNYVVDGEDFTE